MSDGTVVYPSAVREPATGTLDRAPGSARRTTSIDMVPRGTTYEGLALRGAARDLLTGADGSATLLAEATVVAEVGAGRILESLRAQPALPALQDLVGRVVGRGFRGAVDEAIPGEAAAQSPLYLVVDDLPVAALIAGYADMYVRPPMRVPAGSTKTDICAGWVHDGTMLEITDRTGYIPLPEGPEAPALERADDPLAWHELPVLPDGAMRRRRLIDVRQVGPAQLEVRAMFRDTHARAGIQYVLHEYALDAAIEEGRFTRCVALPRVLPWPECPNAAASAGGLVGRTPAEVREHVRANFRGISTCTHLNDMLRSLADVVPLVRALDDPPSPT